jgi:hypothetical protein
MPRPAIERSTVIPVEMPSHDTVDGVASPAPAAAEPAAETTRTSSAISPRSR